MRVRSLGLFCIVVVCTWLGIWMFNRKSPSAGTLDTAQATTSPARVNPAIAGGSTSDTTSAARQPTTAQNSLYVSAKEKSLQAFLATVAVLPSWVAREAGLTVEQEVVIKELAWEARIKLNEELAARGKIETLGPTEKVFFVKLDKASVERLRGDFRAQLQQKLGDEVVTRLDRVGATKFIDSSLDYWGSYATAYRVDLPKGTDPLSIVKFDRITDKDTGATVTYTFERSLFEQVYGPVAERILTGPK